MVPVLGRWTYATDGRMEVDHTLSHKITRGICIKATEDRQPQGEQSIEPSGVRPCTGGGDATMGRMKSVATESIDR